MPKNSSRNAANFSVTLEAPEHDLRELPSPLPLERTLELAEQLVSGQVLRVLTPYYPSPLLDILTARGFDVGTSILADGGTRVQVRLAAAYDPTLD